MKPILPRRMAVLESAYREAINKPAPAKVKRKPQQVKRQRLPDGTIVTFARKLNKAEKKRGKKAKHRAALG